MTPEQRIEAVVFNAVGPALREHGEWLQLKARQAVARGVLAALAEAGMVVVPVGDVGAVLDEILGGEGLVVVPAEQVPPSEEEIRADERQRIAAGFSALAARYRQVAESRRNPDGTALNVGQIWDATEQAMHWEDAAHRVAENLLPRRTEAERDSERRQMADEIAHAIANRRCDFRACVACTCRMEDAALAQRMGREVLRSSGSFSGSAENDPDRQSHPTAWAYEQACKALEKQRERAEEAEATIARVDALHQPKQADITILCGVHNGLALTRPIRPAETEACPDCTTRTEALCSDIRCCWWPCGPHLALHDETEETCAHA